jgi:rhamnogalacturonan endolyase
MGYEFWTRSDGGGHFTIPKVRPGTYALYASVPGVVGEVKVDNVQVNPDQTTNIGNIQWSPPSRQQLIWRLGVPDRSAGEFRFGDQPRQFGLWWQYMQEMRTRDVNYTIGKSDPKKDWYYAQSVVAMPGVGLFSPRWNINFDMGSTQLTGPVRLTVDLAGTAGERNILHIYLNGREIGQIDSPNDSGIYRDAVKSSDFRHNVIEFDAKNLAQGMNRLTFIIEAGSRTVIATAGGSMPEIPSAGVSYDCVQLEAGPITGDGSYKIAPMN